MRKIKPVLVISILVICFLCSVGFSSTEAQKDEKIDSIMSYPIPNIIKRCQKDFGYNDADIIVLEKELKRYLTLCILDDSANFGMYSKDVDNLWHTFILFTKEYAQFCNTFAGKFIHHIPEVNECRSPEQMMQALKGFRHFTQVYQQVFNENVHAIWFLDMVERQNKTLE